MANQSMLAKQQGVRFEHTRTLLNVFNIILRRGKAVQRKMEVALGSDMSQKSSFQKFLERFGRSGNREVADGSSAKQSSDREKSAIGPTGETIFGDRALRFRNLTSQEADVASLMDPANLDDGFKIRLTKLPTRTRDAGTLIKHRYGGRGYRIPPVKQDPNLLTFIAYDESVLVGTVAIRIDSDRGLSADELYSPELERLRQSGARLCEFTRLAVDKSTVSKPVLAGLFHTAYLYAAVIRGCTHAVIEVTPQHSSFYRRALAFQIIGAERLNPRVNTYGVLMMVPFQAIAEGVAKYAGKPDAPGAGRSLFVYGFPPSEEAGVLNRLYARQEVSSLLASSM